MIELSGHDCEPGGPQPTLQPAAFDPVDPHRLPPSPPSQRMLLFVGSPDLGRPLGHNPLALKQAERRAMESPGFKPLDDRGPLGTGHGRDG